MTNLIEHVGLSEFRLEVGGSCENQTGNVGLVVLDEHLHRRLRHFAHVVVPLLHSQTRETQRRLTTAT